MSCRNLLLLAVAIAVPSVVYAGLKCYDCEGVSNLADCTNMTICQLDEVCSATLADRGSGRLYALGCMPQQQCSQMVPPTSGHVVVGRAVPQCFNVCCPYDLCNQHLCPDNLASSGPGQCEDDRNYNCGVVMSTFDICSDIQHAKLVCRKSCNLCDLVDGGWSDWSSWSACDVTCESGHMIRRRTCTNPAPAKGGLDCIGTSEESQTCSSAACPVVGGWSDWEQWSPCSKTCGVGIRSHVRTCSNPYPGQGGRDCDGDTTSYDVCFDGSCANGGWSEWSAWDGCSATCNGGIMSRSRQCNNPAPSQFGQECPGDSHGYTACSVQPCQGDSVFFSVNSPNGTTVDGGVPIFSVIASNAGQGYNESSGCFQCDTPGIYSFSMTLLADNSSSTYCYVKHNGVSVGYTQATASGGSLQSGSSSVYLNLSQSDTVCPLCGGWSSVHKSIGTSFMGALIRQ